MPTAQMKTYELYRKACRLGLPGCLEDQVCDRVGLRYQGKVTRLDFDRLGAHALGHEAFEIWIDCSVVRRNGIETPLRPPGCMSRFAREQSPMERLLDCIKDL